MRKDDFRNSNMVAIIREADRDPVADYAWQRIPDSPSSFSVNSMSRVLVLSRASAEDFRCCLWVFFLIASSSSRV